MLKSDTVLVKLENLCYRQSIDNNCIKMTSLHKIVIVLLSTFRLFIRYQVVINKKKQAKVLVEILSRLRV